MLEFLKMFGMGILYTILSPVILVFFLLFVVYTIGNYLVCEVIYLGGFFMGRRFSEQTELDKKLEKAKKERVSEGLNNIAEENETQAVVNNDEDGDIHA